MLVRVDENVIRGSLYQFGHSPNMLLGLRSRLGVRFRAPVLLCLGHSSLWTGVVTASRVRMGGWRREHSMEEMWKPWMKSSKKGVMAGYIALVVIS